MDAEFWFDELPLPETPTVMPTLADEEASSPTPTLPVIPVETARAETGAAERSARTEATAAMFFIIAIFLGLAW
jgi:hypothetical protein